MSQLGKVCSACHRERSKTKSIAYHPETLQPYCESPYICNTDHPNAPVNLLKRGSELKLLSLDEAQQVFKETLYREVGDPDKIVKIKNMVDKPMTIRIGDPALATFLVSLQDSYGLLSMSDTIRYCINVVKENKGEFYRDAKRVEEIQKDQRQEEEFVKEVEHIANPEPEPEQEPETEKEEEWDF